MSNQTKSRKRIRWRIVTRALALVLIVVWYGAAIYGLPQLIASGDRFDWFLQIVKSIVLLVIAMQLVTSIRQHLRETGAAS